MRWLTFVSTFVLMAVPAFAADIFWDNGGVGSSFQNPGNWNPNAVPGSTDRAIYRIDSGIVTFSTSQLIADLEIAGNVGTQADVTFNLQGRNLNILNELQISLGNTPFGIREGDFVLNGSGIVNVNGVVDVGVQEGGVSLDGYGRLTVTNGARLQADTLDVDHGLVTVDSGGVVNASQSFSQGVIHVGSGGEYSTPSLILQDASGQIDRGVLRVEDGVATIGELIVENSSPVGTRVSVDGGNLLVNSLTYNSSASLLDHTDGTLTINGGTFSNGGGELSVGSTSGNPLMRLINDGTTGATASQTTVFVGENADEMGAFEISGAGSQLTASSEIRVGNSGMGSLAVNNSGSAAATGRFYVGIGAESTGNVSVNNGSIHTDDQLIVGYIGNGHIEMTNGATATARRMILGAISSDPGFGQDSLDIQSGASVTTSTGGIYLGGGFNRDAIVTVDGLGSSLNSATELWVGNSGNAELTITNGGVVTSDFVRIGNGSESTGSVIISDSESRLTSSTTLYVGYDGNGSLTQNDGHVEGTGIAIGRNSNSVGTYVVNDGNVVGNDGLLVGVEGQGTFTQNGGVVNVTNELSMGHFSTVDGTGNGTYDMNGGTLTVTGDGFVGKAGIGTMDLAGESEVNVTNNLDVGLENIGQVDVRDNSHVMVGNDLTIGHLVDGDGTLNLHGGQIDVGQDVQIARTAGGTGHLEVSAGLLNVTRNLELATNDTATMTVSGGQVMVGDMFRLSQKSGGNARLDITGGQIDVTGYFRVASRAVSIVEQSSGVVDVGVDLYVALEDTSTGLYEQSGGTVTVGDDLFIGFEDGSEGYYTLTGGSLTVEHNTFVSYSGDGEMWVSDSGTFTTGSMLVGFFNPDAAAGEPASLAFLRVSSGGTANVLNDLEIGRNAETAGHVTVQDDSSSLAVGGGLSLGQGGKGTLSLYNSGIANVAGTTTLWNSDDTLIIDGGTLSTGSLDNSNGGTLDHLDGTLEINGGTFDNGPMNLVVTSDIGVPLLRLMNGATMDEVLVVVGQLEDPEGDLEIAGAGSLLNASADVVIAASPNTRASLTVSDNGQIDIGDDLVIGSGGEGYATFESSALINVTAKLTIGSSDNSQGELFVDDSDLIVAGQTIVGRQGSGLLRCQLHISFCFS